ncbi:tyrosinase family oxidase copper chaperone [Streptomyces sp. NPDC059582]|uniref:tyrosinase family oxidase copper chaperone n=1 Tax=Streptomyces sp. NPDC059582 TaxID=3346875 RepID=UPI0036C12735
MVVSVGGSVAVGAERAAARPGPRTRRGLLRGLLACAAAVALTPLVAASRPPRSVDGVDVDGVAFDETYHGRRIQGVQLSGGQHISAVGASTLGTATEGSAEWQVTVDGRPLHLMRRADGSWLSLVDHYRSYATPLEAARAAVDELGPGQQLRETGPAHGSHSEMARMGLMGAMGGRHGLHA